MLCDQACACAVPVLPGTCITPFALPTGTADLHTRDIAHRDLKSVSPPELPCLALLPAALRRMTPTASPLPTHAHPPLKQQGNLLVDAHWSVKVADFSLSRVLDRQTKQASTVVREQPSHRAYRPCC